jgi:DNA-directed RNA polymerase subunit RPC12/RpoP
MDNNKIYNVNGNLWCRTDNEIELLCNKNNCRTIMREKSIEDPLGNIQIFINSTGMVCPKCGHEIIIHPKLLATKIDVECIIKSSKYKNMDIIDIDGIDIPLAKKKLSTRENLEYFVTANLIESKRGKQLVIYTGKKGDNNRDKKTHILVDPEVKRLSFDPKDIHPNDTFLEVKAVFKDGSSHTINSQDSGA